MAAAPPFLAFFFGEGAVAAAAAGALPFLVWGAGCLDDAGGGFEELALRLLPPDM